MAAIDTTTCPNCEARVRVNAARCRRCRHRVRAGRRPTVEGGLAVAIVVLLGVAAGAFVADRVSASGSREPLILPPTPATAKSQVKQTIREYWSLREAGDERSLTRAHGLLTGSLGRQSAESWVARTRTVGITTADVLHVWVTDLRGRRATATAKVTTRSQRAGCETWMIRYSMIFGDGGWRMAGSTAGAKPCALDGADGA